jgi:hypothetical protein
VNLSSDYVYPTNLPVHKQRPHLGFFVGFFLFERSIFHSALSHCNTVIFDADKIHGTLGIRYTAVTGLSVFNIVDKYREILFSLGQKF